jgi:SAM-dependent methyltransferase
MTTASARPTAKTLMHCPCPAHTSPPRAVFSRGEVDFRQCPECGLLFRGSFPSQRELDKIYDDAFSDANVDQMNTEQESGEFATHAYVEFLCRKFVRPGLRVLDFGAATGVLVGALRSRGLDADGVEYSSKAREYAEQHRRIHLLPTLDGIDNETYDFITSIEVIEHVVNLSETFAALNRILTPVGRVFVTTPNRRGLRARLEGGEWREARKKFHLFLFDEHSLTFHLRETGFQHCRLERFPPIVRHGLAAAGYGRATQCLGLAGTLCMVASKC